ncbi:MAG: nuclear transport factor 2 family protein [Dehalococcoidia bacterium]
MSGHDSAVGRLYEAFIAGDEAGLDKVFADDATWHEPGGVEGFSGDHRGKAAILAFFGKVAEKSGGTFRPEKHDILVSDQHEILVFRGQASAGGRSLDATQVLLAHTRDGRISEVWMHVGGDLSAWEGFWSGG